MSAAYQVRGNARHLPLADKSVQCVVTSPPFHGLRAYGTDPQIWGGDPECEHEWLNESRVLQKGTISEKQSTHKGNNGSGFVAVGATCTRCGSWKGELGSEPHVSMFIEHLVEVFREVKRVLRDDGVFFCNIGDGYSGSGKGPTGHNGIGNQTKRQGFQDQVSGGRAKSLQLVPERLAIALSDDGWIIRSRIAWCKKSAMPESCDDRPTSAWEHIWQLTKSNKTLFWTHRYGPGTRTQPAPDHRWVKDGVEVMDEPENAKANGWKRINLWRGHDYFWDADAVRQPNSRNWSNTESGGQSIRSDEYRAVSGDNHRGFSQDANPAGANLRNFWVLSPDPYPLAHYATFPKRIPELCIRAASSEYGACAAPGCGAPWVRTTTRETRYVGNSAKAGRTAVEINGSGKWAGFQEGNKALKSGPVVDTTTTGWAPTCTHTGAGVRPCIVLDPFGGSQTTAFVAAQMGRIGIGLELSAEYISQAQSGRLSQCFLPLAPSPADVGVGE